MTARLTLTIACAAALIACVVASNSYGPSYNEGYESQQAPAYGQQSYQQAPAYHAPAYRAPSWAKHSQYDNYYPKYQSYGAAPRPAYSAQKPSYGYQAPASYEQNSYSAPQSQDSEYYARA